MGRFPPENKDTGEQACLRTREKAEAPNYSQSQPHINLALARVYINDEESKLGARTWLEVMGNIVAKKSGEKQRHWESAIRDKNFDCIRDLGGDVGAGYFRGKQFAMQDHPFAVSSEWLRDIG